MINYMMKSIKRYMILLLALAAIGGGACSDNEATIHVLPTVSGTFTDERDGTEYHWVRLGGLDWMTENLRYVPETGVFAPDLTEPYPGYYDDGQDTLYYKLHGGLYDYETALAAVPEGWRLPTDEDWQQLEQFLGMSQGEAVLEGWRGEGVATLMRQGEGGTGLQLSLSGYVCLSGSTQSLTLYNGDFGYFWTATEKKDEAQTATFVYFRKIFGPINTVYRGITPLNQLMRVRCVRDVQ